MCCLSVRHVPQPLAGLAKAEYAARPNTLQSLERDAETTDYLRRAGWTVLRYWEHEDPESVADQVQESSAQRGKKPTEEPPAS